MMTAYPLTNQALIGAEERRFDVTCILFSYVIYTRVALPRVQFYAPERFVFHRSTAETRTADYLPLCCRIGL